MAAYYNEIDPYCAQWLRNLIAAGHIAPGEVDERSITEVQPDDLSGFTQCHFFAGIGIWSLAARLAGWPDDRPVWTGSCPCQPFSVAGKQKGFADERHLWPVWRDLIAERRPAAVFGEQVSAASDWLRIVRSDLEAMGYAVGCQAIQAASAGADHLRDRYWFVADHQSQRWGEGRPEHEVRSGRPAAAGDGCTGVGQADASRGLQSEGCQSEQRRWAGDSGPFDWVIGADGKSRRVKPGIRLLVNGHPNRVAKLRAFGNAIDPRPAAQWIGAFLDCEREVA